MGGEAGGWHRTGIGRILFLNSLKLHHLYSSFVLELLKEASFCGQTPDLCARRWPSQRLCIRDGASCSAEPANHFHPPPHWMPIPPNSHFPPFFSLYFSPFISDQTSDDGNTDKLMIVINKN